MVTLSNEVRELGISEEDVLCMLRAVGSRPIDGYTLMDKEAALDLLHRAREAEVERNRRVAKWESILAEYE